MKIKEETTITVSLSKKDLQEIIFKEVLERLHQNHPAVQKSDLRLEVLYSAEDYDGNPDFWATVKAKVKTPS